MVRSQVGENVVAKPGYRAVVFTPYLDIANLSAAVDRRLNVFAPAFNPFDRHAKLNRYPTEQCFFSVDVELRTKTASDFGSYHPQFVFGHSNHQRELSS